MQKRLSRSRGYSIRLLWSRTARRAVCVIRLARTDACMEQELEDLQQRFALLEGDRKAFYEQSQVTLKHNKDTADELRAENKDLKQALSALRKERANCNKGVTGAQR